LFSSRLYTNRNLGTKGLSEIKDQRLIRNEHCDNLVMVLVVKKVGVSFSPSPALVILYTEEGKVRRREMPLRELKSDSDCRSVVGRLRLRHNKHLVSVSEVRLERLVLLAREHLRGHSLTQALGHVDQAFKVDPQEDLNKLSDTELQRRKDIMDLHFERNNIGQGHPEFVYDKQVDFLGEKEAGDWDDGSDVEEEEESTPRNAPLSPKGEENAVSIAELSGADEEDDFW